MGTPKKRQSHSRSRMRRSHDALTPVHTAECSRCGNTSRRPHTVCENCGTYRNRVVYDVEAETE